MDKNLLKATEDYSDLDTATSDRGLWKVVCPFEKGRYSSEF